MCMPKAPSPPPAPEPLPPTPPSVVAGVTGTKQNAPQTAGQDANGVDASASNKSRLRLGRGSLRIPLAGEGSGLNFPTS